MDHTVVTLQSTPYLPLPRSSPEGATTEWTVTAPADEAYYTTVIDFNVDLTASNNYNYNHQTLHSDGPSSVLANQLTLHRKVKGQGHRVTVQ